MRKRYDHMRKRYGGHQMSRVWMQRLGAAAVWLSAIAAWRWFQTSQDLSSIETAQFLVDSIDGAWWGLLAFGLAYLLRPVLLFPATIATVAAGLLFGPVVGVLAVVVAANASAMVAFVIGRFLAGQPSSPSELDEDEAGLIARWGDRMRNKSFETVFIMRLLFVPYDLVNYMSGALRIRWTSFLLATALGTLPGTIAFVLLGASIERLDEGFGGINPLTIVASVAIFVASLIIARVIGNRSAAPESTGDEIEATPTEQLEFVEV